MHNRIYGMIKQYTDIEYRVIGNTDACYNNYEGPELSFYDHAEDGLLREVRRVIDNSIWYEVMEELSDE